MIFTKRVSKVLSWVAVFGLVFQTSFANFASVAIAQGAPGAQAETDLGVGVSTHTPDPIVLGGQVTFDTDVENFGPEDVSDAAVRIIHHHPNQFDYLSSLGGGYLCVEQNSQTIWCVIDNLVSGSAITLSLTFDVDSTLHSGSSYCVEVVPGNRSHGSPYVDTNSDNDSNCIVPNFAQVPDEDPTYNVAIVKLVEGEQSIEVEAGDSIEYTLTVTNEGPDAAEGIEVNDPLAAGLALTGISTTAGVNCPGDMFPCSIALLAVGDSEVITLEVLVDEEVEEDTVIMNTSTISAEFDTDDSDNTDSASITIVDGGVKIDICHALPEQAANAYVHLRVNEHAVDGEGHNDHSKHKGDIIPVVDQNGDGVIDVNDCFIDLAVTKTDGLEEIEAGETLTYTITVENLVGAIVDEVLVTDEFPTDKLENISWTCDDCGITEPQTGDINETISLDRNESVVFTVTATVRADATGTIINTAVISSDVDANEENNSSTDTTEIIEPDVTIDDDEEIDVAIDIINVVPNPVTAGEMLTLTFIAKNNGPLAATNVSVTVALPAGVSFVPAAAATSAQCSLTAASVATCEIGDLAVDESAQLSVDVEVDEATRGTITFTSTVTSAQQEFESNLVNNVDTADVNVVAPDLIPDGNPDLDLTPDLGPDLIPDVGADDSHDELADTGAGAMFPMVLGLQLLGGLALIRRFRF
jgi:uncharacterized repeat protein (TIGR01451 family)